MAFPPNIPRASAPPCCVNPPSCSPWPGAASGSLMGPALPADHAELISLMLGCPGLLGSVGPCPSQLCFTAGNLSPLQPGALTSWTSEFHNRPWMSDTTT